MSVLALDSLVPRAHQRVEFLSLEASKCLELSRPLQAISPLPASTLWEWALRSSTVIPFASFLLPRNSLFLAF